MTASAGWSAYARIAKFVDGGAPDFAPLTKEPRNFNR
jgi:hypothetical protein